MSSWQPTRDTFLLWLPVIGKVQLARTPLLQHWWNSTLHLTARGMTTSTTHTTRRPERPSSG